MTVDSPGPAPDQGMVWIPGGEFAMGSERFYPEERPVRRVGVDGFWMDQHPVTVEQFARFVDETGYVTVAERPLDPADYPGADPEALVPGSLVFRKTAGPVDLSDYRNWWQYEPGASWRRPSGKGSSSTGRPTHPVVHVAWEDVSGVLRVGRQGAADGGRVGVRRPRRPRRRGLRLGRRALPRRAGRWRTRGRASSRGRTCWSTARGDLAGRQLPAQRLRPGRHDGERLGVDQRLLHDPPAEHPALLLRPGQPQGDQPGGAFAAAGIRAHTSPGWSSRAARTCARRTTACATGPRPGSRRWSTPGPRTWASDALCGPKAD